MIILNLKRVKRSKRGIKLKKIFYVLFLSFILVTLVGCGNNSAEYQSDLNGVADKILENSADIEEILNAYSSIWSYSIESKGAIPVDSMMAKTGLDKDTVEKHFVINNAGNIPDDFSTNIHSLNLYYTETGALGEIEQVSDEIKEKINGLNNPSDEYEKAYDEVLDMYTYSEEYIEMALNPSGSLQSFNEAKNQLSSDILSQHKRIEAIMPSED